MLKWRFLEVSNRIINHDEIGFKIKPQKSHFILRRLCKTYNKMVILYNSRKMLNLTILPSSLPPGSQAAPNFGLPTPLPTSRQASPNFGLPTSYSPTNRQPGVSQLRTSNFLLPCLPAVRPLPTSDFGLPTPLPTGSQASSNFGLPTSYSHPISSNLTNHI